MRLPSSLSPLGSQSPGNQDYSVPLWGHYGKPAQCDKEGLWRNASLDKEEDS